MLLGPRLGFGDGLVVAERHAVGAAQRNLDFGPETGSHRAVRPSRAAKLGCSSVATAVRNA
jgi:hypothetical protein